MQENKQFEIIILLDVDDAETSNCQKYGVNP